MLHAPMLQRPSRSLSAAPRLLSCQACASHAITPSVPPPSTVQVHTLREAFADVSLRMAAAGDPAAMAARLGAFAAAEAERSCLPVVESWRLRDQCYRVAGVVR